jgi:hypothetical protein
MATTAQALKVVVVTEGVVSGGINPLARGEKKERNHGTQDSRVVPHRGTNWAALWLTAQIERDAVLSKSYGRGYYTL